MSNALAIAAVTATLKHVLQDGFTSNGGALDPTLSGVGNTTVTILPLDKARGNNTGNQLNLFLYQIQRNSAWVNSDIPQQVRQGETGSPPLPLNLWYLLTAFGQNDDTDNSLQPFGHHVLSKAMSILHDHPVLSPAVILAATQGILPASDLDKQIERIRITFQPLSVEEIYRLWTGFATPYRLSAAYEAAVALIESTRPSKTPLPVLTRGKDDKGFTSHTGLTPPLPALSSIEPPNNQPSGLLGDLLTLVGHDLDGSNISVQFTHPLWTVPVEVAPEPDATAAKLHVKIPNSPATWHTGVYSVAVLVQRPRETDRRSTSGPSFSLAPQITSITAARAASGAVTFTVHCSPFVPVEQNGDHFKLGQRARLLIGDLPEIPADPPAAPASSTDTLIFATASSISAGEYRVRLRIDGVDSLLVNRNVTPPVFDPNQTVVVQ